ncbi:MAG: hypothetical protein ABL933_10175 [Methyloglobulus sp.]|nr:hypothetical protein [Methyloglobulus sp.]
MKKQFLTTSMVVTLSALMLTPAFAAPGEPVITGSTITSSVSMANINNESNQGTASGGKASVGWGPFSFGGKASKSKTEQVAVINAVINAGITRIHSGQVTGSTITNAVNMANVSNKGGIVNAGVVEIGVPAQ